MPSVVLAPPSLLQWVMEALTLVGKWDESKDDHLPTTTAKVKNDLSYTTTVLSAFMSRTGTSLYTPIQILQKLRCKLTLTCRLHLG